MQILNRTLLGLSILLQLGFAQTRLLQILFLLEDIGLQFLNNNLRPPGAQ